MTEILYAVAAGVATITLNRPTVMNALTSALRRDMRAAVIRAGHEARARGLAQGPTAAYRGVKTALRSSFDNDLTAQLTLEACLQSEAGRSDDFREGVAAFLEKRPARFSGH